MMPSRPLALRALLALAAFAVGAAATRAEPVISEFMASNTTTLADADGAYSDWVELHNPDATTLDLNGWYLTDTASNPTKWMFPPVSIPAGGYLVVFASNKNRRDPAGQLHTNFALSAGGEYLALVKPDGVTVAFAYAPEFPAQTADVSYGVLPRTGGGFGNPVFFSTPTPGRANAGPTTAAATGVVFSRPEGTFTGEFELELKGAGPGEVIRYVIGAPENEGDSVAQHLERAGVEYSGRIRIASSTLVTAAIYSTGGAAVGPATSVYYARISRDLANFNSSLPVLVIDTLGSGPLEKDSVDHPSWMYFFEPRPDSGTALSSNPSLITTGTATVRGSTSALFAKKGLNIKFTDETGRKQPLSPLGLPADAKWALVAPWTYDPAYINNAFMYALSNRIGRWAPRTRFAEVFVNTGGGDVGSAAYAGVYTLSERIELGANRVALSNLSPDDITEPALTGGYLIKLDSPDPDEFAWTTSRGYPQDANTAVVLAGPSADAIAPEQRAYIVDYVQKMEDALFADRATDFAQRTYLDYIDRASWVDHHILNTLSANPDAFTRSAYFHKDRGGKLQAGPVWDFDRAFGSVEDERSFRWDVWSGVGAADVWNTGWWGVIARDPEFMQDWIDRWQLLRRTVFSEGNLLSLAASLSAEVGDAAAARDDARWTEKIKQPGGFAAQTDHFKGWTTVRASWIDAQFVPAPSVTPDGERLVFTAPAGDKLVYTTDGSDPRSLGGAIAPNAIVTTDAVIVPTEANVHVRSYRESMKDVFPGSPWSSVVGGAQSSPLSPAARIANLSTRGLIGSGDSALVTGVTVADTKAKSYLVRAVGPGLAAFGVKGFVPDPQLTLTNAAGTELLRNNRWQESPDAALLPTYARSVGAFPLAADSADAAVVARLTAGTYSLRSTSLTGTAGSGLVELYELDSQGRTAGISTRAYVRPGDGTLTGGLNVQGPAYKRLLVRAVGPGLKDLGVGNALADPVLTIYAGTTVVATNDRWDAGADAAVIRAATTQTGAFQLPAGSEDAALVITLPPGGFTVEVKGKGDSEGVALLDIRELP